MDVTIVNQCTNIEMTFSAYFIKYVACHIQFPHQVNVNCIMEANFITGIGRDTFGGALLYHLQGKEDTSISTQLLVIWGYSHDELYSHTLLIEHESTFVWNEDRLKSLYNIYSSQYGAYSDIEGWLLDNNTSLKVVFESSHGGFKIQVVISEDKYSSSLRKPLWIDPNR
jgi:hypothetical protein